VVGDVHPGANPLVQGLFAHRHPDLRGLRRLLDDAVGPYRVLLLPPFGPGMGVEARGVPLTFDDDVHIAVMPETRAQGGRRTWLPHELSVDGDDVVDRDGALRVPVLDAFGMAIFIAGVRAFELYPGGPHTARVTLGRTVLRRECWRVPAAAVPGDARALAAFGRDRGMPRRVFAKSPLERKPMYVDLDSPSLARILCRHAARAAREAPGQPLRFTEMLPAPEQCWLADAEANRYVSELRLVAIDRSLADR
jgi:hypothetical protein